MKKTMSERQVHKLEKFNSVSDVTCKNCGKAKVLHNMLGGCPLPKKGFITNYSQTQTFQSGEQIQ
jgi:hypothetical protein